MSARQDIVNLDRRMDNGFSEHDRRIRELREAVQRIEVRPTHTGTAADTRTFDWSTAPNTTSLEIAPGGDYGGNVAVAQAPSVFMPVVDRALPRRAVAAMILVLQNQLDAMPIARGEDVTAHAEAEAEIVALHEWLGPLTDDEQAAAEALYGRIT